MQRSLQTECAGCGWIHQRCCQILQRDQKPSKWHLSLHQSAERIGMPFSVLDERIRDSEAVGVQLRTEGVRVQRFKKEAIHPEEDEMVPGEGVDAEPGPSDADRREMKETVEGGSTLDWPEAEVAQSETRGTISEKMSSKFFFS
ncbi:hypothetical protein SRHO_G00254190 [Serrasalmus rhombeus]